MGAGFLILGIAVSAYGRFLVVDRLLFQLLESVVKLRHLWLSRPSCRSSCLFLGSVSWSDSLSSP